MSEISELREHLDSDSKEREARLNARLEKIEGKVDSIITEQSAIKVDAATAKGKADAVSVRLDGLEGTMKKAGLGVLAAAAFFLWDRLKGSHP